MTNIHWYQELLHDHYRNPRNKGVLEHPSINHECYNPLCGDRVSITGLIEEDVLKKLMFVGTGCIISQAAASLLTEHFVDQPLETILAYDKEYILTLLGIELGPVRLKCALLPLETIQEAISTYKTLRKSNGIRSHTSDAGVTKKI